MDADNETRPEDVVVPVLEETARVDVRQVERERVLIRTKVEARDEVVTRALRDETLIVERVPIGREVETAPAVREEDGVLIVPVIEEELIVRTRLILKEELRVRRQETQRTARVPVRLRREIVSVERAAPETSQQKEHE